MNTLKLFAATALAAAVVGAGALGTAPSASALPDRSVCNGLALKGRIAQNLGDFWYGVGDYGRATRYYGQSEAYFDAAADCFRGSR
jgi:hypothetical protein